MEFLTFVNFVALKTNQFRERVHTSSVAMLMTEKAGSDDIYLVEVTNKTPLKRKKGAESLTFTRTKVNWLKKIN